MGSSQSSSRAPPPQQPRSVDNKQPVRAFRPIPDRYETIEEVQRDLRKAGLESSNLIIGIDYTESNTSSGKRSFGGRSLHEIDPKGAVLNPYQRVISAIARVLEPFDDDNIIPTYGFGDHRTGDKSCFELFSDGFGCNGLDEVLERYNKITPLVKLWGPTSFAPLIREAIETVKRDGGYHILVIIADGQLSKVEPTRDAIIEASKWPISIIMVGVGDGPWDMMEEFDDKLPTRRFDNFQFVDYGTVMKRSMRNPDAGFAMAALMEVPEQYRTIRELGMLDH